MSGTTYTTPKTIRKVRSVSLSDDESADLDLLARILRCSRSEAVRRAVESALASDRPGLEQSGPESLPIEQNPEGELT
jgi:metal-responsive CopG/Arc/MetJ family transcriptional regulator